MIYKVELSFSDPAREDEWNAWYETYLAQLVSLPGLSTAQRHRARWRASETYDSHHRGRNRKFAPLEGDRGAGGLRPDHQTLCLTPSNTAVT